MRGCVWVALLRCVPPEKHNILMLVTKCGIEIAIQNILRLDDELLAIRGRLAGSQDAGRLYFVPLDSIEYCGFNCAIKEEDYTALFGNLQLPPLAPPPAAVVPAAAAAPPPQDAPPPEAVAEPAPESPPTTPLRTPAIKSEVLERFRARTTANSPNGAGPRSE